MQTNSSSIESFFSTPPSKCDRFHSKNMKKVNKEATYLIHSLKTLGELLAEKKQGNEEPDLRYLVSTSGEAWFARESHCNVPFAPAHYKMTGAPSNAAYCKSAGNLFFSADYTTLLRVNHKSGDFRPSFDSMKWLLAILIVNEEKLPFKLPEELIIEELGHSGYIIKSHHIPINCLKTWVATLQSDGELMQMLEAQNAETNKVTYGNNNPERVFCPTGDVKKRKESSLSRLDIKARKLSFDENDDNSLSTENTPTPTLSGSLFRNISQKLSFSTLENSEFQRKTSLSLFPSASTSTAPETNLRFEPLFFPMHKASQSDDDFLSTSNTSTSTAPKISLGPVSQQLFFPKSAAAQNNELDASDELDASESITKRLFF